MDPIIRLENVHYTYQTESDDPIHALRGIDLTVQAGEYLVILGHNGSGKSTLAKHLNALFLPTEGDVWVKSWNTKEHNHTRDVRSTVGMVFQTPDNQIVATIVEEDVAFGPENLGLPHEEIVRRVDWSLEQVGMLPFRHRAPHLLSGGQKQRICIAGMLAMRPEVLVMDESTAMLDPLGRREVLETAYRLNKEEGVTIIAITHYMEEAIDADRLVVLEAGRIALQGTPREIFSQAKRLRELQIDVPQITQLATKLNERDSAFPKDILNIDEFVTAVRRHMPVQNGQPPSPPGHSEPPSPAEAIIQIKDLTYYYMYDTPLQVKAVAGVNMEIYQGEILGIIGHTGSGKSTIIQHFNALLRPHIGSLTIFGQDVNEKGLDVKDIRRRIGLVFQQPEAQLFEHYVGDDIAYGPRNLKLSREEVRAKVKWAMELVGLGFEEFKDRITFGLSGGQMRRVALAGVLALEPEALVLDEPTAGLDPQGRKQLLDHILRLHREHGMTLVLVSHNMEELARVCDRICVIGDGQVVSVGTPAEVFGQPQMLRDLGLGVPAVTEAVDRLRAAGLICDAGVALDVAQASELLGMVLHE
ncbi:MAG: energy-coupling factor transporter ATPase [Chloroflexi bacterium]|nr:energy-coupling factor transporter ATPase [Chloroflexota bacterium]